MSSNGSSLHIKKYICEFPYIFSIVFSYKINIIKCINSIFEKYTVLCLQDELIRYSMYNALRITQVLFTMNVEFQIVNECIIIVKQQNFVFPNFMHDHSCIRICIIIIIYVFITVHKFTVRPRFLK